MTVEILYRNSGSKKASSNAILNLKIALLVFSKHSSVAFTPEDIKVKNIIEKVIALNFFTNII